MRLRFAPGPFLLSMLVASTAPGEAQEPVIGGPPLPAVTLPPELDRVLRDYQRAWRAGDEGALAELFTEDGFVPTREGWTRGRGAIRTAYADASGGLALRAHAFALSDTVGYIVGAYSYGDGRPGSGGGKFLLALRRQPGGPWLIAADLDNANRP